MALLCQLLVLLQWPAVETLLFRYFLRHLGERIKYFLSGFQLDFNCSRQERIGVNVLLEPLLLPGRGACEDPDRVALNLWLLAER